ncbi:hypothetical protein ACSEUT_18760 [Pseudomonas aeruginosa]
MSSTQHQLIKQCATRLRGIVEALDNIHDTSPHRWSTDLDEVHSSAESLLALIKDQAPARSEASFEEWLANELEGEDGQPVPAAVCDIALARRAFNHWPKLEQPAKVGGVRFSAGVSSRLVVEAAQRLYEFESTPEQEAERIERLQAFREQLDPLNLAPHAKAFNEAPAEALKSEQAEAERPEVVAWQYRVTAGPQTGWSLWHPGKGEEFERSYTVERRPLMTVAQHERIVGALRARLQAAEDRADTLEHRMMGMMTRHFAEAWRNRDTQKALDGYLSAGIAQLEQERDAALARVAELELKLDQSDYAYDNDRHHMRGMAKQAAEAIQVFTGHDSGANLAHRYGEKWWEHLDELRDALLAFAKNAPPAQAQHSVPDHAELLQALERTHAGHMVGHDQSDQPKGGYSDGYVNGFGECIKVARKVLAAAPGREVPQAWLDVQAERRRQVEAEGWTPEHDDEHSHGQMARVAACYALAGSSAPNDGTAALLVSLAWPWGQQWWNPTTTRRDLVKACALALAEIERLDRASISQSPQPGATTASS